MSLISIEGTAVYDCFGNLIIKDIGRLHGLFAFKLGN